MPATPATRPLNTSKLLAESPRSAPPIVDARGVKFDMSPACRSDLPRTLTGPYSDLPDSIRWHDPRAAQAAREALEPGWLLIRKHLAQALGGELRVDLEELRPEAAGFVAA